MATENLIDELLEDARRADGQVGRVRPHEFSTVRTGRASPALLDRVDRRLLRCDDAAQPARDDLRAGSAAADRPAVRQVLDQGDREGDQRVRRRPEPVQRRQRRAPGGARADRRAPPRAGQGRAQPRRGGARGDAQRAPRHDAAPARAEGRGRSVLRRRASRGGRAAEADRRARSATSTACSRPRKRRSSRSDGRRRGTRRRRPIASDPRPASASAPSLRWRATSRSSPTATAAGRAPAACRSTRGTARARTPSRRACATPPSSGIEEFTVYSFSTENWSRPAEEVTGPDGDVLAAHRRRDARAPRGRRADALHRPPRGRRRASCASRCAGRKS